MSWRANPSDRGTSRVIHGDTVPQGWPRSIRAAGGWCRAHGNAERWVAVAPAASVTVTEKVNVPTGRRLPDNRLLGANVRPAGMSAARHLQGAVPPAAVIAS